MTTDEWHRAKALFSCAVQLNPSERANFLDAQADSEATLDEVRSLLSAYQESPDFLDDDSTDGSVQPPDASTGSGEEKLMRRLEALLHSDDADDPRSIGTSSGSPDDAGTAASDDETFDRIGPYTIVRRLGEGGMGVAFLAERTDGAYQQKVAIKVLKRDLHAHGLERRFQNERQVLAELDHPYIARLIDGGTTASGQLYYVMEYVPGESVIVYANSRGLGLRERLVLFMAVCEAVSAAHRHLVIHGDIKPGNILVNEDGSPKLLDFGLARVMQPAAAEVTMSMVLLTPGYASPEQVRGERLSTATDIYSLGVLLFELLTGQSPYGEAATSPLDLCRAICDFAPLKPSAASTTAVAGLTPRQLRGDLDHVVQKTLRKSAAERYESVNELREDIQRYLCGFPVKAARGSTFYFIRKFVSRRRWYVALAIVLLVLASLAVWRIRRAQVVAEQRFNDARQLAHIMVFDVHDAIQDLPGSTSARKLLVERALDYLKRLEKTTGRNRDLELELARAYARIGTVQAASAGASMDDCAAGVQNLEHARSLLKDILQRNSADEEALSALIDADHDAANVHARRGEMRAWELLRAEYTALLNNMAARHPNDTRIRLRALISIAETLDGEHNPDAALKAYQDALAVAAHSPVDPEILLLQARAERDIGEEVQALGDKRSALEHQRAALRIFEELLAASPLNTRFRLETSWSFTETAWLEHAFHDDRAAMSDFREAMHLLRTITAADPGNQRARLETGKLELTEAPTVERAEGIAASAGVLRDALSIFDQALKLDPTNDDARVHYAQTELSYGDLQMRLAHHDWCAGEIYYQHALAAASAVKDDRSATSVFDMQKTRDALRSRLEKCRSSASQ